MSRLVCVETEDGELFIRLEQICQAIVTPESIQVEYVNGKTHLFSGVAASTLLQSLRHEEKQTAGN